MSNEIFDKLSSLNSTPPRELYVVRQLTRETLSTTYSITRTQYFRSTRYRPLQLSLSQMHFVFTWWPCAIGISPCTGTAVATAPIAGTAVGRPDDELLAIPQGCATGNAALG